MKLTIILFASMALGIIIAEVFVRVMTHQYGKMFHIV